MAERPEMVILWDGYSFARGYNTPRGHRHCIEDLRKIMRTGSPGVDGQEDLQPGTCWTCKGPDVMRLMSVKKEQINSMLPSGATGDQRS